MKNSNQEKNLRLASAPKNSFGVIVSMTGDRDFVSKAAGLGLTPGARVRVVQNYRVGPVIIYLRDSQIALGRAEARKITLREG